MNLPAPRPASAASGWIVDAGFDLRFFFGSAVLAVAVGLLAMLRPGTILPLWLGWIWLIEGPHLFATWQRTWFDAAYRQQHQRLLQRSLIWLTPGLACWGVSVLVGRSEPFLLFLAIATVWSFHHTIRQYHGILSIYQRLCHAAPRNLLQDKRLLHGILWLAFALFLLAHPANRAQLGLLAQKSGLENVLTALLSVFLAGGLLLWGGLLLARWRRGQALKPGVFGLAVACGSTLFSLFVVGSREPLLANASTPEQMFMAATLVSGGLHGIHYLGMVVATSRRRAAKGNADGHTTLAQRLGRQPWLAYALLLALSGAYVVLNLLRGGAPIDWSLAPQSPAAQFFLAIYWGLFFHHYWLDQHIWKPSKDAQLRAELNLGAA
jgi:hypothetical protein